MEKSFAFAIYVDVNIIHLHTSRPWNEKQNHWHEVAFFRLFSSFSLMLRKNWKDKIWIHIKLRSEKYMDEPYFTYSISLFSFWMFVFYYLNSICEKWWKSNSQNSIFEVVILKCWKKIRMDCTEFAGEYRKLSILNIILRFRLC